MSIEVLQSREQIAQARRMLAERGLSRGRPFPGIAGLLRRLGFRTTTPIGDRVKSWDLERSADFIERHVPRSGRILDLGADASELPYVLHAAHYRCVVGIDRSPALWRMPRREGLSLVRGDFLTAPLRDSAVDVVTAISVIEHGYAPDELFAEVSRVLRPGGYFVFSCDYWPEKIDTTGLSAFGMDWTIFSRADLIGLLGVADRYGLQVSDPVQLEAREAPIRWNGRRYTFAWAVLQKGESSE